MPGSQKMVINGCQFINDRAAMMMGCDGVACFQSLEIHNSTFANDRDVLFEISNSKSNSTLNVLIDSSNFSDSSGVLEVNAFDSTQNVTVVNSIFASASSAGTTGTSYNGVFYMATNNSNTTVNIGASQFIQSRSDKHGGVLWLDTLGSNVTLTVTDSSFNHSKAQTNGGSFYVQGHLIDIMMSNVNITNSSAKLGGFLYLLPDDSATIHFSGGLVSANTTSYGGMFYITQASDASIAVYIYIDGTYFDGSMNNVTNGTIIFATVSTLTLSMMGVHVMNHQIIPFVLSGGIVDVSVENSRFEYNTADSIFALDDAGNSAQLSFSSYNTIWQFNQVTTNSSFGGGCICLWCASSCSQSVYLTNNTFLNNTHNLTGGVLAMASLSGPLNQTLSLTKNIWTGNQANDGGCIYLAAPNGGSQSISGNGDNISNNSALNNGGFLYLNGTSPMLSLFRMNFTNNTAAEDGGVFFLAGTTTLSVTVADCVANHSKAAIGGVFYAATFTSTQVYLVNSNFSQNSATADMGGILAAYIANGTSSPSFMEVVNCTLTGNQAVSGGGFGLNATSVTYMQIIMTNNTVTDGYATNGSLLSMYQSSTSFASFGYIMVSNNSFQNASANNGGVFYITHDGTMMQLTNMTNNQFVSNNATQGAVIYLDAPTTPHTFNLTNNQFFYHNTPSLFYLNSTSCLVNSTANEYTNINADSQFAISATQAGLVSDSDQILHNVGRWLDVQMSVGGSTPFANVSISHLTAFNPQSWQLINMASTVGSGQQNLTLLNVNITGEVSQAKWTSIPSLVNMQASGTMNQSLNVTNSVISQVNGTTFDLIGGHFGNVVKQFVSFRNTTMKQLNTSVSLQLSLAADIQSVEWVDSTWEACQATLLQASELTTLNISNCQFESNIALNGPLLAVNAATGNVTFTSNQFLNNQAQDAVIRLNGPTRSRFVDHTVANDSPLHLWVIDNTSQVDLAGVYAAYSSSTPLLAKWDQPANVSLGKLELAMLNATSNLTVLSYGAQPKPWASAVVDYVNTTRGCFNSQLMYTATQAFAVLNSVACSSLNIPPNATGNVTVTGVVVLYPNQTLNISTGVQLQVEEGSCLLLQGDLHLRVDASALPNSQPVLIQGCFDGQFGNVTFDNTNNPHICQVSATYAPTQVMMNLKACDDGLVASAVPVGAIVGGVVGGVVFVTLVVILIIYFVKRQQRKQMTKDLETKLERANHYSKARSKNVGSEATS